MGRDSGFGARSGLGGDVAGPDENAGPPPERIGSVYAEAEAAAAAHAGDCPEALRLVRHALSVDPTDDAAFNLRGYCLRKTGDLRGAFKAYENALKLRSRFPEAREYLAEAHVDAALAQAEVLRGYGPEGAQALRGLAQALRRAAAEVGTLDSDETARGAVGW